ncbi:MAG: hypothetical protein ACYC35_07450 [Pirellulales bacterium]
MPEMIPPDFEPSMHQLCRDIDAGIEQLDRGLGVRIEDEQSLDAFFNDIRERGRRRLEAQGNSK